MSTPDLDYAYNAALAFANELRAADGLPPLPELPRGRRGEQSACPLARATCWTVGLFNCTRKDQVRPMPEPVVTFVEAFDDGEFVDLESA